MCESLETTSKVTDHQQEMINFFQQNKLVESRWLVMRRWRPFYAQLCQVLRLLGTSGNRTSFLPLVFFDDMPWRVKAFQTT